MPETTNRKFKILGTAWLALGGIFLALALLAFVSVVLGDDPDAQAFEAGDKWWIVVLVLLGVGAILMVPGLALLRRDPVARSLLIISSLVLLIPFRRPLGRWLLAAPLASSALCWSWCPAYGSRCQKVARRRTRAIWRGRQAKYFMLTSTFTLIFIAF